MKAGKYHRNGAGTDLGLSKWYRYRSRIIEMVPVERALLRESWFRIASSRERKETGVGGGNTCSGGLLACIVCNIPAESAHTPQKYMAEGIYVCSGEVDNWVNSHKRNGDPPVHAGRVSPYTKAVIVPPYGGVPVVIAVCALRISTKLGG